MLIIKRILNPLMNTKINDKLLLDVLLFLYF